MQLYSINKGREGLLVKPNGDIEPYIAKRGHALTSDDIAMDPIRLSNDVRQGFYKKPVAAFEAACEKLAKNGYTVFHLRGTSGEYTWGFAIIVTEDDTEMD